MRVLIAALCLAAAPAFADLVATNRAGDELRLTQAPCTHEGILNGIKEEYRAQFKAGNANIHGKRFDLCWIDPGEGVYYVLFDDMETGAFPVSAFIEKGI